jgi:hypothetical protein
MSPGEAFRQSFRSRFPPLHIPRPLRPLTALARLAARDLGRGEPFEPEATPGRALALLAHRWSGRIG